MRDRKKKNRTGKLDLFTTGYECDILSIGNEPINLKFDTKSSGKPVKSRLPVFCLYVVYLPDLKQEKFL